MLSAIHTAYPSIYFLSVIIAVFFGLLIWGLAKPQISQNTDPLLALHAQLSKLIDERTTKSRIHNQKIQLFRANKLIAIFTLSSSTKKSSTGRQTPNIRQLDDVWIIDFDKYPSAKQLKRLLKSHQLL